MSEIEIIKAKYSAPEWFIEKWEKNKSLCSNLLIKEGFTKQYFKKGTELTKEEEDEMIEEMMSFSKKNPRINEVAKIHNFYKNYLWAKLRYEKWETYGTEATLKYDDAKKEIQIIKKRNAIPSFF